MNVLLVLFLLASDKSVEVRYTEVAPRIDGHIEDLWLTADSAYDFIQHAPYEKTAPEQKTTVYVLQDANNIYFAFRCYADKYRPIAAYTKDEDNVRVSIDPFGSKTTGYYFLVFGSNLQWDGWVLDDGRQWDDSWEGVWYRATGVYDDRLEVEIKIPFKSIRYKKDLSEWGVEFMRYTAKTRETDFWTEITSDEGELVSKWGTLKGVNPQASGYYFELFPEGYVRYDQRSYTDSSTTKFTPKGSMNLKWDITPQTTLNGTLYPDFAQIESDPFTLNLGRYPTYLRERRPFFIEGTDIFRMPGFGGWGFFTPLELFYSRRIGRSINGDAIPIIGGLKLTNTSKEWNFGLLGAYTDKYETNDTLVEPGHGFGVFRLRHSMMQNSEIGMLFSGSMEDKDNYNYAVGIDGVYRRGPSQFIIQGAMSGRNNTKGYAVTSGFLSNFKNFRIFGSGFYSDDSFDVGDIGYVPWAGLKEFNLFAGPYKSFAAGFLRNIYANIGAVLQQQPGDSNWSYLGFIEVGPNYRNQWSNYLNIHYGKSYEADTNYIYRSIGFNTNGNLGGQIFNIGCWYGYQYNYARGYPAYQGSNNFVYNYSLFDNLSVGVNISHWIEWDSTNTIISMMPLLRPQSVVRFTSNMTLTAFVELVMSTPGTDLNETELYSVRPAMLFSWNFRPKSWLYIAFNDYQSQDGLGVGDMYHRYTIGAVKVKYLLYF